MSSDSHHKVQHLLLFANNQLSSFQIIYEAYKEFLALGQRIKMYSLEPFGQEFVGVILMEANQKNLRLMDMIVVVGDNDTLMKVIRYYSCKDAPPIMGIANGCGPGLYNYLKFQAREVADNVIKSLANGTIASQKVMKLNCNINCETVMESVCQLQIHRNMKEPIIILNLYLENEQKAKVKIGVLKGDGLLISTPMGSYCKSLNLNGPLMSKTMENIMITPICPLSMKFRPICLPASSRIFIEIDPHCRTDHAQLYFDEGGFSSRLNKGELLRIRTSKYKASLVTSLQQGCEELFIKTLKNTIRWGQNIENMQLHEMLLRKKASQI